MTSQPSVEPNLVAFPARGFGVALLMSIISVSVIGWLFHGPSGRDDAYKTYWPAKTLCESGLITNYNGESVEQSSSLLHVMLLALGAFTTGYDIPGVALASGIFFAALSIALAWLWMRMEKVPDWASWCVLLPAPPLVYWAWSGMDTALAGFCFIFFLFQTYLLTRKPLGWPWVVSMVLFLTVRPEAVLLGLVCLTLVTIYLVWIGEAGHINARRFGWAIVWFSIAFGVLAGLRLFWTGEFFPQTVVAKEGSISPDRWWMGLRYLWLGAKGQPLVLLMAGTVVFTLVRFLRFKSDLLALLLSLGMLATLFFVVFSGGDWMENGRLWAPVIPIFTVLMGIQLGAISRQIQFAVLVLFGLSLFWGYLTEVNTQSTGSPAWSRFQEPGHASFHWTERTNRIHARDLEMIDHLKSAVDSHWMCHGYRPLILSQQAGLVMYHLASTHMGRFRFVDLVALSTRDFTDCDLTQNRGSGFGGLNMDLFYLSEHLDLLDKECGVPPPDIIFDLDHAEKKKQKALRKVGYEIIWSDSGWVGNVGWGLEVEKGQFLAVRSNCL